MKKLHTALCVCALVLVCILVLPTRAEAAIVDSGTCGYHLSWKLDSSGTLTISGSGTMTDWFWSSPWYDNDAIKTVVIKNGVTTIGDYAFNSCCNLTSVTIPNTVTAIGASAFYDCDSLASITIPDSVTTIGDSAFGTCNGLTRVSITDLSAWCKISFGNHLSNPMYYADTLYLNGAKPSGAIKIANGVTAIPAGTFRNCTGLTSLTIPDSVASIGDSAFYDCARLNKVTMGNSVTTIGDSAFYDCDSLTSVAIPNSVTTIGDSVFYDCDGLTKVTIPDSVTAIGNYAFCDCDSLTGVTIPNSITIIENMVFFSCDSLTSVTIPNSVTTIDYGAFGNCSNLIGVTIPDSVTTIGEGAFRRCASLQYVVMGSAMDMVDEDAFYNCSNLRHVLFRGNQAQKDYLLFKNGNDYIKNATWHLNATGKEVTTEQFCNQTYAYCTICKCYLKGDPSTASHVYDDAKDGTCNICGQTRVRITKQPASVVVANGKTAKVTVSAAGEGLTYKWYFKNKGASKFSLTTTFTGNTYSVAMGASRSGRQVYCVITDKYGNTVKTNTVTLSMKATITKQPASVVVANGKAATVTVNAAGEGLTYKWYFKNKGASKFSLTTTFTGNTYSVTMNASRSGRQVYCKVTDKYGNTVTTKTVTLSMKVTITKQPASVVVANGKTAKVTVSAAGEGLTYKWYYKNKGASKFSLTTTFTGNTYSVTMNASRSGRQVYCKVTDKFGNTVKTNTVTLKRK